MNGHLPLQNIILDGIGESIEDAKWSGGVASVPRGPEGEVILNEYATNKKAC